MGRAGRLDDEGLLEFDRLVAEVVEQPHPSFYAIDVQLNGSGSVTCKIKVDGKTISAAHASGTDHLIGYVSGTTL